MDATTAEPVTEPPARTGHVRFSGKRGALLALLLRGFLLYVPTLGIYRFWLLTWKRRFYWAHTEIDGDSLEYTGNARQLLVGFLIALLVFVPLYGFFFWLSLQDTDLTVIGYIAVAVLLYFLAGYAMFRARRFRLTRTLWRGIRFHQSGSAWSYAFRRFGWVLLMCLTLGLVYPLMTASLWRYRYRHTWFGDRQFTFEGSGRTIAAPFYLTIVVVAAILVLPVIVLAITQSDVLLSLMPIFALFCIYFGFVFVQSRTLSRLWSSVSAGQARLQVTVKARSLMGMHLIYLLTLLGMFIALGVVVAILVAVFSQQGPSLANYAELLKTSKMGFINLAAIVAAYLAAMAIFGVISELVFGLGYWKMVANGATIENIDDLQSVQALGDESPLGGEGLADALNVGAY